MPEAPVSPAHRRLLVTAATLSFLLVAMGSVVCVTNASGGCPDWPRCHGSLVPPAAMSSIIEYTHRLVALVTGPLILAAAVLGWRRREPSLRVLPVIAVALTIAVAIFGRFAVLTGLPPIAAALDVSFALGVLALMTISAVASTVAASGEGVEERRPIAALAIGSLAAMFVYFVAGVLLGQGSAMRCVGGPMLSSSAAGWMTVARALAGGLAAALVLMTAVSSRNAGARTRRWSLAAGALVCVEAVLASGLPSEPGAALLIPSAVVTVAAFCSTVVVAARAALPGRAAATATDPAACAGEQSASGGVDRRSRRVS